VNRALADHCLALLLELICRRGAPCGHSSLHVPALLFPFIHYPGPSAKVKRKGGPRLCVPSDVRLYSHVREMLENISEFVKLQRTIATILNGRLRNVLFLVSEITGPASRSNKTNDCLSAIKGDVLSNHADSKLLRVSPLALPIEPLLEISPRLRKIFSALSASYDIRSRCLLICA